MHPSERPQLHPNGYTDAVKPIPVYSPDAKDSICKRYRAQFPTSTRPQLSRMDGPRCRVCYQTIYVGDPITWDRQGPNAGAAKSVRHVNCQDRHGDSMFARMVAQLNAQQAATQPQPTPQPQPIQQPDTQPTDDTLDGTQPQPDMNGQLDSIIGSIVTSIVGQVQPQFDAIRAEIAEVRRIAEHALAVAQNAQAEAANVAPTAITVQGGATTSVDYTVPTGHQHPQFQTLLGRMLDLRDESLAAPTRDCNIMLVGPAGSGKTYAAEQLAKCIRRTADADGNPIPSDAPEDAYRLPMYAQGAVFSATKLMGYQDANGVYQATQFYRCYRYGGVFCFDEMDASDPTQLVGFNQAGANGYCDFPGHLEPVIRHPDCYLVGGMNTMGMGGDSRYAGRKALDGATLNRFMYIVWEVDETLELAISGADQETWVKLCQHVRRSAKAGGAHIIVSPRQSLKGARLLRKGASRQQVAELSFAQYMLNDGFKQEWLTKCAGHDVARWVNTGEFVPQAAR